MMVTLEKDTNRTFSNNRNNSNRMIHHIIDTNSLISNLWSWLILINNNSSSNNNKRKMMMMMVDRNKDMFNSKWMMIIIGQYKRQRIVTITLVI